MVVDGVRLADHAAERTEILQRAAAPAKARGVEEGVIGAGGGFGVAGDVTERIDGLPDGSIPAQRAEGHRRAAEVEERAAVALRGVARSGDVAGARDRGCGDLRSARQ